MTRVLVLDDDEDLRRLLGAALQGRGLEVEGAGTGAAAAVAHAARPAELIVVDGQLPDLEGPTFIEQLRATDRRTRIVFLTGVLRDLGTFRRLTELLDVSWVAYKPVDAGLVAERVCALLEQHREAGGASPPPTEPVSELELLRREYGARIPAKVSALEAALGAARSGSAPLSEALTLAHRLRGTAGSYGFVALGEAAGRLEDLLLALEHPGPIEEASWAGVEAAISALAQTARQVAPRSAAAQSAHATVLVVDDDPEFLELARAASRQLGFELVTASSAEEAIARAQAQPLLGAMLDVNLQGERAFSLASRLRSTPSNEALPLAFASVEHGLHARLAALDAGATRYFDKPISLERFGELVQHFLSLSSGERQRAIVASGDATRRQRWASWLGSPRLEVEAVGSAEALLERLQTTPLDLLLVDEELPRVSGIDVCRMVRASDQWNLVPIILVTSSPEEWRRIAAFQAGASDAVANPLPMLELRARAGMQIERGRLMRERIDKDPLTGLLLRRPFLDALQRLLALSERQKHPLCLALIDLDRFKRINDELGHLTGDLVLRRLGESLRQTLRTEDICARWGGEEFMIALPNQSREKGRQALQRALDVFAAISFESDRAERFRASFTAGVATYPDDGVAASALIRRADELLYLGKAQGRARVVA